MITHQPIEIANEHDVIEPPVTSEIKHCEIELWHLHALFPNLLLSEKTANPLLSYLNVSLNDLLKMALCGAGAFITFASEFLARTYSRNSASIGQGVPTTCVRLASLRATSSSRDACALPSGRDLCVDLAGGFLPPARIEQKCPSDILCLDKLGSHIVETLT